MLAELFTLFLVIGKIGFLKTFFLCLCAAMGGTLLIQRQGAEAFLKMQGFVTQRTVPVDNLFGNLLLVLAGTLFIIPGFISDIAGFFLLVPFVRKLLMDFARDRYGTRTNSSASYEDGVIDGHYVRVEESMEQIEQDRNFTKNSAEE